MGGVLEIVRKASSVDKAARADGLWDLVISEFGCYMTFSHLRLRLLTLLTRRSADLLLEFAVTYPPVLWSVVKEGGKT